MQSLRARVIVSVLALSAAGLVLLAAVTYAEQRSFLLERVDQQVMQAGAGMSQLLDGEGDFPAGTSPEAKRSREGDGKGALDRRFFQGAGGPPVNFPPGTYGQRRERDGTVIGKAVQVPYESSYLPAPDLPSSLPVGRLLTVASVGGSGLHYRVFVHQDPEDAALTVVAVPLHEVEQTLSQLLLVEALVIGGVLAALGVGSFFVVKVGLRPLDRMEVTAEAIAGGDLSRRVSPATRKTEIGRLGLALNAMLDRLEQAFAQRTASEERLRRFLADASHELRTPLASIRGYAELFRMGAADDRESTELAMRRIEQESKRMGVLVEDLLTLARLDEAPELQRDSVDLVVLARDAVQDARATAPDREIDLEAPEHAVIFGDAHQLRQVLANLLRNALVHTPAGAPVEVSVTARSGWVDLAVRDHGPGLPPGTHETIFDRFWRAEGGREKGKAGAGLGLAIAREAVLRHHGHISAADAPGGGAVFLVELPAEQPRQPAQDHAGAAA